MDETLASVAEVMSINSINYFRQALLINDP